LAAARKWRETKAGTEPLLTVAAPPWVTLMQRERYQELQNSSHNNSRSTLVFVYARGQSTLASAMRSPLSGCGVFKLFHIFYGDTLLPQYRSKLALFLVLELLALEASQGR
jgi:hypothetical protein